MRAGATFNLTRLGLDRHHPTSLAQLCGETGGLCGWLCERWSCSAAPPRRPSTLLAEMVLSENRGCCCRRAGWGMFRPLFAGAYQRIDEVLTEQRAVAVAPR